MHVLGFPRTRCVPCTSWGSLDPYVLTSEIEPKPLLSVRQPLSSPRPTRLLFTSAVAEPPPPTFPLGGFSDPHYSPRSPPSPLPDRVSTVGQLQQPSPNNKPLLESSLPASLPLLYSPALAKHHQSSVDSRYSPHRLLSGPNTSPLKFRSSS